MVKTGKTTEDTKSRERGATERHRLKRSIQKEECNYRKAKAEKGHMKQEQGKMMQKRKKKRRNKCGKRTAKRRRVR